MRNAIGLFALLAASAAAAQAPAAPEAAAARPIVIAHRGASGYLPEHTLEAYAYAYALGADYIEPDLVRTKDGRFIALHDIHLEATTDVEQVFPERKRADGRWYAADFTLDEIKRLNAHERLPRRFPQGQGRFQLPTIEEVVDLVQGLNQSTGRDVGIYPEMKEPSFHDREGLPMEAALLDVLARYGYRGPEARVFIQCFEPGPLKKLRADLGSTLPQIFLMGGGAKRKIAEADLDEIKTFADGIGPDKATVEAQPGLVAMAHARGLLVHPYTVRRDAKPAAYAATEDELRRFFFDYKVDGLFVDFPDDAVRVLQR